MTDGRLPGNVDMAKRSVFAPILGPVTALSSYPAKAGHQTDILLYPLISNIECGLEEQP